MSRNSVGLKSINQNVNFPLSHNLLQYQTQGVFYSRTEQVHLSVSDWAITALPVWLPSTFQVVMHGASAQQWNNKGTKEH